MTYTYPNVTYSGPKATCSDQRMTYTYPKVTYTYPEVTCSGSKVTHSDPTHLPLPQPTSHCPHLPISYVKLNSVMEVVGGKQL